MYLGCDWQNVPLHLPSTFTAYRGLVNSTHVQVAMLGEYGLTWPWESLHVEALAWFDHWLKGRDTGILDGPPIRYVVPGADGWRTTQTWPPAGTTHRELALRSDGLLSDDEGESGDRAYMALGAGVGQSQAITTGPPSHLAWTTAPLPANLDMIGEIGVQLDAVSTAADTAWIVTLQDVDADDRVTDVTAGYLRASLRQADEHQSRRGAPEIPCRTSEAVPVGELVHYRIPLVTNARRFATGHRIRLFLTSDDQDPATPAMLQFRHASVGSSTLNTIHSSSRLLLPTS